MSGKSSCNTSERIARAKAGDESARAELLAGNEAWIAGLVARFGGSFDNAVYTHDDRMQDARRAFILALDSWKRTGGANLRTWGYLKIRRKLLETQQRQVRHSAIITGTNDQSFADDCTIDEGADELPFSDIPEDARAAARRAYEDLPYTHRVALRGLVHRRTEGPPNKALAKLALKRIRAVLRAGGFLP